VNVDVVGNTLQTDPELALLFVATYQPFEKIIYWVLHGYLHARVNVVVEKSAKAHPDGKGVAVVCPYTVAPLYCTPRRVE
jgi:hypothetical protein